MRVFIRLVAVWCAVLLLGACASVQNQRRAAMHSIETHELAPDKVFLYKDDVYIHYTYDDKAFYFVAPARPNQKKGISYSLLTPRRATESDKYSRAQEVVPVDRRWGEVLKEVLLSQLPENPGEGRLLFVQTYEMLLYKRADGTADLMPLEQAPAEVRLVGRVSAEEFDKLLFEHLKQRAEASGQPYRRFLLRLEHVPLTPFLYVDIENHILTPLQLAPYYELQKEMSRLGFSAAFVWSFFVKSHVFGVLKAPFTSSWRLVTLTGDSVYTAFPPGYSDLTDIPPVNTSAEGMDLAAWDRWLDQHVTRQNYKAEVTLLVDGEEFFPHFILAVQRARKSVFTRVYIFGTDPYGIKIADLLKSRSARGVDVRVLTDELNTVLNSAKEPELNYPPDFVMPRSIKSYLRKKSRAKARTHYNTWATFDHTKVYLVDRELAYTGGMNIGEEYRYTWHDMMVALRGPVVGRLVKNFYEAWSFNGWGGDFAAAYRKLFSKKRRQANRAGPGMVDVRLLYTKPGQAEIFHAQLEAIRRAQKRIYIENAYLSDDRIVGELVKARGRGVDVRVILPGQNDVGLMDANNQIMANKLWRNGVRVYFYRGMSHVKAALYDGWAVIGSANFDKMSLFVNQEMSLGISDPAFVAQLQERLFEKDFASSDEMDKPREVAWTSFVIDALANQL